MCCGVHFPFIRETNIFLHKLIIKNEMSGIHLSENKLY